MSRTKPFSAADKTPVRLGFAMGVAARTLGIVWIIDGRLPDGNGELRWTVTDYITGSPIVDAVS
jgi:hypothetical protein